MGPCSESPSLNLHPVGLPMFSSSSFRVWVPHVDLQSTWSWFCKGKRYSSSLMRLYVDIRFHQHHLLKVLSFLKRVCSCHHCWELDGSSYVCSQLSLWLCFIGLHVGVCPSTILLLLLWLCRISWLCNGNPSVLFTQDCLPSGVSCGTRRIWDSFSIMWRIRWGFW